MLPEVTPGRGSGWLGTRRLFTVHCLTPLNFKSCAYIIIPKCFIKSNKIRKERREGEKKKRKQGEGEKEKYSWEIVLRK